MISRRLMSGIVLTLVATVAFSGVSLSAPAAAQAAVPAAGIDFTPSGNKAREWMLNVLGSVLKGATPNNFKREIIANQNRYNFGWETLAAELGSAGPLNGNYRKNPSSYDDFILKGIEKKSTTLGSRAKSMFAVPSTKMGKLTKVAGGVGAVMVGWDLGSWAGREISGFMGMNPESATCGGDTFLGVDWDAAFVGADCDSWLSLSAEYLPNEDITVKPPGFDGVPSFNAGLWGGTGSSATVVFGGLSGAPEFGQAGNVPVTVGLSGNVYGTCVGNGRNFTSFLAPVMRQSGGGTTSGSTVTPFGSSGVSLGAPCDNASGLGSWSGTLGNANLTFDHFEVFVINRQDSVNWYPEGHELWTPGTDPDPVRVLTCEIQGTDGNSYTADSAEYRESDGGLPQISCPALPDGVYPASTKVVDSQGNVLFEESSTPEFLDWADDFWYCDTGSCKLDLLDVTGAHPVSCFDSEACDGWFESPTRDTTYQCQYGGEVVALSECYVYSGTFDPARIAIGAPYSDPETGLWSGGVNGPKPGEEAMGSPVMDPAKARNCWGNGWAEFNPVEWVMQPIQCALQWAFVPREGVVQLEGARMVTALDGVAPGQLVSMIGGWEIDPSPMTGCSRSVPWSPADVFDTATGTTELWNVCPGSEFEMLGTISRSVVAVSFAVMVFLALKRSVGKTVDY